MIQANAPRVSCILPVYNGEEFIESAAASILNQSFCDFELIIINDGSTDKTKEIIQSLSKVDQRIVLIHKTNGGIVSALNHGLRIARGEYIARMDADDLSFQDRFEFQVNYLDSHPECVLVGGIAALGATQHSIVRQVTGGRYQKTNLSLFPPRVAVSMHPLIMLRRASIVQIGGYSDAYPHAEDYDLFIRLSRFGTIDNPPRQILFYRRHDDAISIKHLDVQEESAVKAEINAINEAGFGPISDWLIEPYIRLRIFRRLQTIDVQRARSLMLAVLADLFSLSPKIILSAKYWRLRFVMLYNIVKFMARYTKQPMKI